MKFFQDLRRLLRLMSIDIFGSVANLHLRTLKADLAIRKAVDEARIQFEATGVRYFVIPTPEHQKLRIVNASQVRSMIDSGYLPASWKVTNIYNLAFFWTDSSRHPKYGHSLESFNNMNKYYDWFYNR